MADDVVSPHPRRPNPSVTAQSAATAPLSGEPRAWVEACSVYASVYHDADTVVFLSPVRGGVLDAPPLPVRRGGMVAAVERDQLHPRHLRCVRLRLSPNVCKSRGHSPRTISHGRTDVIRSPTPGGRGSPPLRWVVTWVGGRRCFSPPTSPQPLSHAASRRDSSPFRGAEAWEEVCGVYASVYLYADTVVFLSPVRGGVLDAPPLPVRRGGMVAAVERDQLHPRHLRCVRLRLSPNVCKPAGTARAPFHAAMCRCIRPSRLPRCKNPPAGPVDFFQVSSTPHIAPLRWPTTIQLLYTAGVASNLPEQLSASYCSPVRPSSRYIYWPSVQ